MRLPISLCPAGPEPRRIAGDHPSQLREIMNETKKKQTVEHLCLTVSCRGGYSAGSSPSGCGGKEAASAIPCGIIVDRAWITWGRWVDSVQW